MISDDTPSNPEREQTDESLRVEREKVDHALGEEVAAIDAAADAVIVKARARADELVAAARARTDRQTQPPSMQSPKSVAHKRQQEDRAIEEERAEADETVRAERAEHIALLSAERQETDQDLLSERARADDAVAMRDDFLGIVSHDLRNMLSSVVGFAQVIATEVRENRLEQVVGHAERIQRSGARMNRLIGDLVDVASIEAGRLAVTCELGDPTQVITEVLDIFQTQAAAGGVSLGVEIVPSSLLVPFDPARILQVLTNLLSNAIKFTPHGGQVVLRFAHCEGGVLFTVTDSGGGIPPDKLEAVFERYRQLLPNDRRGVGLGLYISKCIVQGHGGRIWAESKVGEGSTFSFTLPLQVAA